MIAVLCPKPRKLRRWQTHLRLERLRRELARLHEWVRGSGLTERQMRDRIAEHRRFVDRWQKVKRRKR